MLPIKEGQMNLVISLVILVCGTFLIVLLIPKIERVIDTNVKSAEEYYSKIIGYLPPKRAILGELVIILILFILFFWRVQWNPSDFLLFLWDHIFIIFLIIVLFLVPLISQIRDILKRVSKE
jgi:hypothetical protein